MNIPPARGTGVFNFESLPMRDAGKAAFDALINEKSKWLTSDNAALPLGKGQSWERIEDIRVSRRATSGRRSTTFGFTAKAFGIRLRCCAAMSPDEGRANQF